jgi:hypothetical protein
VRRPMRSANAPDGTSATIPIADHSANSPEISPSESPVSANSRA